jgi:hypothetical protein
VEIYNEKSQELGSSVQSNRLTKTVLRVLFCMLFTLLACNPFPLPSPFLTLPSQCLIVCGDVLKRLPFHFHLIEKWLVGIEKWLVGIFTASLLFFSPYQFL